MNKTDDEIMNDWSRLNSTHIQQALYHLKKHEGDIRDYLSDCVAALCSVSTDEMFSDSDVSSFAHARWLYWYSCRYLTNESYDKISKNKSIGHSFCLRTIQNGVNKMAMMIETEAIWKKRWSVIKKIIKMNDGDETTNIIDNVIVITIPKELNKKINVVIKEK